MKPVLKEVIKLSPDYPEDLIIFEVKGSLQQKYYNDFFKLLRLHVSISNTIILDMSMVEMITPAIIDKFVSFTSELKIRDKKLLLVKIPEEIYAYQIKTINTAELIFYKNIDEALESIDLKK